MKIRLGETEMFDAIRHDEADSYYSQFWERAENICDKTYVKPLSNTLYD